MKVNSRRIEPSTSKISKRLISCLSSQGNQSKRKKDLMLHSFILICTVGHVPVCNVKWITCSNEKTENNHLTLQFPSPPQLWWTQRTLPVQQQTDRVSDQLLNILEHSAAKEKAFPLGWWWWKQKVNIYHRWSKISFQVNANVAVCLLDV